MHGASISPAFAPSSVLAGVLTCALLFAPLVGCTPPEPEAESETDGIAPVDPTARSATAPFADSVSGTWQTISDTTGSGLTIISEKCALGSRMALDATKAAWIWSSDTSADGWNWIAANAGGATQWARDSANQAWAVTRTSADEFSLWVRVKTDDGVAWARTALPAAWKMTKNAAGVAVVWIDEHKVEVAVAAAVVAVVVAGLIVAPEGVAPAVVKGAVAGTSAETARFLTDLWKHRGDSPQAPALQDVSHDLFLSIGKSVIGQCGAQAIGLGADAA